MFKQNASCAKEQTGKLGSDEVEMIIIDVVVRCVYEGLERGKGFGMKDDGVGVESVRIDEIEVVEGELSDEWEGML